MTTYEQLLQTCSSPLLNEESTLLTLPPEIDLQSAWFAGSFGKNFTTTEGHPVEIIDLGEWNRGAGPDFRNCTAKIGNTLHHGDIELDHHPIHWEQHGHSTNPNFNQVILHLVFQESSQESHCRDSNHRHIPRALIPQNLLRENIPLSPPSHALAHPGHCAEKISQLPPSALHILLKSAALHRAQGKAQRHQRTVHTHGSPQAFWQALATTLGYGPNKNAFLLLSQRLPIKKLLQQPPENLEAIILGTANLLHPDQHKKSPPDSQHYLETLWKTWWKHRQQFQLDPHRQITFTASGIRPQNHPHRRLAALVQTALHWKTIHPLLKKALHTTSTPNHKALQETLLNLTHPFWNHHYTLTSQRSEKTIALWGLPRINDLLINHLYPLHLEENTDLAWPAYAKIRNSNPSTTVKIAQTRLLHDRPDKDTLIKFHWQQQALQQLYIDYCQKDHSACQNCPLPQQLKSLTTPSS